MIPVRPGYGLDRPHIQRDGRLWICRMRGRNMWGYGFNPSHALAEWLRMNTGKPASAAQHTSLRALMAHVGTFQTENHHVQQA